MTDWEWDKNNSYGYVRCSTLSKMLGKTLCHLVLLQQKLKWLTSLAVDGWSLGWRQAWHRAEVFASKPGGLEDSEPWDWAITGDRPRRGDTGLREEEEEEGEAWQVEEEREEEGRGDRWGLGEGLRGGDRAWGPGECGPPQDVDAEASRRLRANRALLTLAELLWAESLRGGGADCRGSISRLSGPGFSVWRSSAALVLLSSSHPWFLFFAVWSSSRPIFFESDDLGSFCFCGWTEGSSQTPMGHKRFLSTHFPSVLWSLKFRHRGVRLIPWGKNVVFQFLAALGSLSMYQQQKNLLYQSYPSSSSGKLSGITWLVSGLVCIVRQTIKSSKKDQKLLIQTKKIIIIIIL